MNTYAARYPHGEVIILAASMTRALDQARSRWRSDPSRIEKIGD